MVQIKISFLLFILFLSNFSFCQKNKETIEKLKNEFDSLANIGDLKTGGTIINRAFKLIEPTDIQNLSNFHLYAANYLETTDASNDSCKKAYEKALIFAKKAKSNENIIECLGHLINFNYGATELQKKDRAIYGKELLTLLENSKADLEKAKIHTHLQLFYKAEGKDAESLNSALKSLEINKNLFAKSQIKSDELAQAYLQVSRAYRFMDMPEKQDEYLKQMRKYIKDSKELLLIYYSFYARNKFVENKVNEAILFNDSLLRLCNTYDNYNNWFYALEVNIYFTQGFVKKNDIKNATISMTKVNEISRKYTFENMEGNLNYTNGKVLLLTKKYTEALPYFQKAESLAKKFNYGDLYQYSLANVAECFEKTGDWKQAYFYSQKASLVADSLAKISTDAAFIVAEAKFQNKEKQAQIEIKNLQIAQNSTQKKWYLTGLTALLAALGLLFWNYKTKQKANKVIKEKNIVLEKLNTDLTEANQTKAKLFGIISHDLRSPISQVYQYLKLQELNPNLLSTQQKTDLSGKIQTATGSLLETMEDLLLWSKTQLSQFNTNIQQTNLQPIIDQTIQLLKLNIDEKKLIIEQNIHQNSTIITDAYFLQIILRNLLQNAIKVAPENTKITIAFNQNQLKITNHGPIFSQNDFEQIIKSQQKQETLSGLGLKLVDELSQKIGARVYFENEGETTKANIEINV